MLKKNKFKLLFLLFTIITILFAFHAYKYQTGWLNDLILITLPYLTLLYIFRKKLRLNSPTYFILALAMTLHNAGTFGYYNISPIFIQYDHITHFFGLFAVTLLFYNYFSKNIEFGYLEIAIISFLVGMGIGALIEMWELLAHLTRNDFFMGLTLDKTDQGREWINSMIDLVYNSLGCLFVIVVKQLKRIKV
jgi:hypothetical protein